MAEVSVEAECGKPSGEEPQLDSEEEEEVAEESVDSDVGGVMYEIDIDSTEDNVGSGEQGVDVGSQSETVVTCDDGGVTRRSSSVDDGGVEAERHAERTEAPEERGGADAGTKVIFSLLLDSRPVQAAPTVSSCFYQFSPLDLLWWWLLLPFQISCNSCRFSLVGSYLDGDGGCFLLLCRFVSL